MSENRENMSSETPRAESPAAAFVDLEATIQELHTTEAWQRGKAAKRLNTFPNFRVSLMALKAGASLGEHRNPGRVSIQTIAGNVRVVADGKTFPSPPGSIIFLDRNVPHDVQAVEESAFLVTVALEEPPRG